MNNKKGNAKIVRSKSINQGTDVEKFYIIFNGITYILEIVTKWGVIAFLGYRLSLVIMALAGKNTNAYIDVPFLTALFSSEKLFEYMSIIFGISGTLFGIINYKLRKINVKRLTKRLDACEKKLDPNKQSSGINSDGTTQREDEKWNRI